MKLKYIIKVNLKLYKYLFYDIIPEYYTIKWYKKDFDSKLEYYYWLPFRYVGILIISLLDYRIAIHRIAVIIGFMKAILSSEKEKKENGKNEI